MSIFSDHDPIFLEPQIIRESAWLEHIPFMFWITNALKPKLFVELGVHYGVSFFAFCQAVVRFGLTSKAIAIDNWIGDKQAGYFENNVFEDFIKNLNSYSSMASYIRADFDKALIEIKNESVDFAHIDGFHSYEAVKSDFENIFPKLKSNAVLLFHDTHEKAEGYGVYRFWDEIKGKYYTREFSFGHGLGIAFLSTDLSLYPDEIKSFILDDEYFNSISAQVMRQGKLISQDFNIQQLEITKKIYTNEINKLRSDLIKYDYMLKDVFSSNSWKLTGWLRGIIRIMRKFKKKIS
jgi:hypothetical protein